MERWTTKLFEKKEDKTVSQKVREPSGKSLAFFDTNRVSGELFYRCFAQTLRHGVQP